MIDHLNGDGTDNRLSNLRNVEQVVNCENQRKPRSDNKLGLLGVSQHGKWFYAHIRVRGKTKHLGNFTTPAAAHAAYVEAKRVLHAGCTL